MSWEGVSEWAGKISWAKWQKPETLRYQNFIEPMETILGSSNANKQTNKKKKWKKGKKDTIVVKHNYWVWEEKQEASITGAQ